VLRIIAHAPAHDKATSFASSPTDCTQGSAYMRLPSTVSEDSLAGRFVQGEDLGMQHVYAYYATVAVRLECSYAGMFFSSPDDEPAIARGLDARAKGQ
jgi:hypothetical protein